MIYRSLKSISLSMYVKVLNIRPKLRLALLILSLILVSSLKFNALSMITRKSFSLETVSFRFLLTYIPIFTWLAVTRTSVQIFALFVCRRH